MKKRYVLKNRKRFTGFLVCFLAVMFTLVYATSVHGYREPSYKVIRVQKGDTLWSIAQKFNKRGDIRKYIYDIKKLNNLSSSEIFEGDELMVVE